MKKGNLWVLQGDCWIWQKGKTGAGYGAVTGKLAHRALYEVMVGPIPEGMELAHTCHNRACVRPDHLVPMSHRDNILMTLPLKTHCTKGHEMTEENTYIQIKRVRQCRICKYKKAG